jgi:hypothetical protein
LTGNPSTVLLELKSIREGELRKARPAKPLGKVEESLLEELD